MSFGGGGASQQPVTTTQNSSPWVGAQPYLSSALSSAQGLYNSDTGYQPYQGPIQAPIDPRLQTALDTQQNMAGADLGGSAGWNAANTLAQGMMANNGITPNQMGILNWQGDVLNQFSGLRGQAGQTYGQAQGGLGLADKNYAALGAFANNQAGAQNPYLQDVINASNRQISDKVNSAVSGAGRYGSGAHTDVLARSLAESANPILMQDYEARMGRQLGALGAQQGALGARANAISGMNQASQLGLGATQGEEGAFTDIQNVYNQGINRAMNTAQMMPALDQYRYMPSQVMQGVGDYYQARAQNDIANQANIWNAQQARPWENLARANAIYGGAGALGGTKITTAPSTAASPLQRALGGAIAGGGLGSMFGPIGTGAGALGGGALGYFT